MLLMAWKGLRTKAVMTQPTRNCFTSLMLIKHANITENVKQQTQKMLNMALAVINTRDH